MDETLIEAILSVKPLPLPAFAGTGSALRAAASPRGGGLQNDLWLFCGLLLFAALVRCQTFGDPFIGYDEQFYLLVGDRMWHHGALPFVDIFDRKPIGLFLIYAAVRALGGDGFLQYQLVALLVVAATALAVARFARRIAPGSAPIVAACLYVVWLNFMECEGGQAPVFYNGVMILAALLTWRAIATARQRLGLGIAAMLLVGVALQIKYTVVVEGVFFGCALLWASYRDQWPRIRLLAAAALWAGSALLPTLVALGYYRAIGHADEFLFANFRSIFGRLPDPWPAQLRGLLLILGILLPLAALVLASSPGRQSGRVPAVRSYILLWLLAALIGLLLFGNYLNPQSAAPLIAPLVIAGAGFFAQPGRMRRFAPVFLGLMLVLSQIVIAIAIHAKGNRADARALAVAARPRPGRCIYIYDGQPALYLLTHSCLPTRWAFPGHLNTHDEASPRAIGTDPAAEVQRILATRPDAIIDNAPAYDLGNPATHRLVQGMAAQHYHLVLKLPAGNAFRLVYRLNGA